MADETDALDAVASTGVPGLDYIVRGGLPRNRMYLVQGDPGSGKTTLGLQFLLEGKRRGESGIYISFSETRDEILGVANAHGWSLDGIHLVETTAAEQQLTMDDENTLFDRFVIHRANKLAHNLRLLPKSRNLFEDHPKSHINYRSARLRSAIRGFRLWRESARSR